MENEKTPSIRGNKIMEVNPPSVDHSDFVRQQRPEIRGKINSSGCKCGNPNCDGSVCICGNCDCEK